MLADELVKMAAFRELRLGTWLGTPNGQAIADAVDLVLPPQLGIQIDLVVTALRLAAELQQKEGQQKASQAGFILVALAIGICLSHAASSQ